MHAPKRRYKLLDPRAVGGEQSSAGCRLGKRAAASGLLRQSLRKRRAPSHWDAEATDDLLVGQARKRQKQGSRPPRVDFLQAPRSRAALSRPANAASSMRAAAVGNLWRTDHPHARAAGPSLPALFVVPVRGTRNTPRKRGRAWIDAAMKPAAAPPSDPGLRAYLLWSVMRIVAESAVSAAAGQASATEHGLAESCAVGGADCAGPSSDSTGVVQDPPTAMEPAPLAAVNKPVHAQSAIVAAVQSAAPSVAALEDAVLPVAIIRPEPALLVPRPGVPLAYGNLPLSLVPHLLGALRLALAARGLQHPISAAAPTVVLGSGFADAQASRVQAPLAMLSLPVQPSTPVTPLKTPKPPSKQCLLARSACMITLTLKPPCCTPANAAFLYPEQSGEGGSGRTIRSR